MVTGMFGPQTDLDRIPNWGRNLTTTGEDPYLSNQMVSEQISGMQGSGAMPEMKHFVVYNGQNQNANTDITDQGVDRCRREALLVRRDEHPGTLRPQTIPRRTTEKLGRPMSASSGDCARIPRLRRGILARAGSVRLMTQCGAGARPIAARSVDGAADACLGGHVRPVLAGGPRCTR
jgi:hypothetical protein